MLLSASTALAQNAGKPTDTTVTAVEPTEAASALPFGIEGPPPPVPPSVMTRDAQGRATIRAVRITSGLRIDGQLEERVYETVEAITGFIQNVPDQGQPATQKTDAWIFFDDDNIFLSARCWDTAPESEWIANEMQRDSQQLRQNDNFGVVFDTFYDRRNGYQFYTNPLGALVDQQFTNEGNPNRDWNPVWNVRTGRFEGGWTVEMQIPFKSLRYQPGRAQIWGVQLRRGLRRRNEWSYIVALPLAVAGSDGSMGIFRISLFATLVGLEAPPRTQNLELKPFAISGLVTDHTADPMVSEDFSRDFGLDVKYGITPNLTVDFTVNTDFAQVEIDEQQVNLTRFNLFYPEKRDFFLDGRGIFELSRGSILAGGGSDGGAPQPFFSRRIGLNRGRTVPILGGARLTGRLGKFTVGALNIQTDHEPVSGAVATNFTVVRVKRDLLRRSSIGAIFTGRSHSLQGHGSNEVYGVDALLSLHENIAFNGFYAKTRTPGLRGDDTSYQARFDYTADRYGMQVDHLFIGDHFNPEVGFVRRDDMRRTFLSGRFSPRPRSSDVVRRLFGQGSLEYIVGTSGQLETREHQASFEMELQNSDRLSVEFSRTYESLVRPFEIVPGVQVPAAGYEFQLIRGSYALGQQRELSGRVGFERGGFYEGTLTSASFSQGRLELTRQLSIEPSVAVSWIDLPYGEFTTQLYRARTTYTFTPRMFLSGLLQYNSSSDTVSTNLRLRWEYSPGSELFVVYTEDRDTETFTNRFAELLNRAFMIKFNRLFRF